MLSGAALWIDIDIMSLTWTQAPYLLQTDRSTPLGQNQMTTVISLDRRIVVGEADERPDAL